MDRITINHAQQSLQPTGAYFTSESEFPYFAEWTQAERRWPHEPTVMELSMRLNRYRLAADHLINQQRQEITRLAQQERQLRKELEARERRIIQLEQRARHQTQIRDLLVGLHIRTERIEAQLRLPPLLTDRSPKDPRINLEELDPLPPHLVEEPNPELTFV